MNAKLIVGGIACAGIIGVAAAWVQPEAPTGPKKYSNVEWFTILNIDYYPGDEDAAFKTIFDDFMPAARSAGFSGNVYEYSTGGEWDLTIIFPMPEGPAGLEWEISEQNLAWMSALAERVGGPEKAGDMIEEYVARIARHESQIVRNRTDD